MRLALGFCGPFAKAAFSSRSVRKRRAGRHVEVRRVFFIFIFHAVVLELRRPFSFSPRRRGLGPFHAVHGARAVTRRRGLCDWRGTFTSPFAFLSCSSSRLISLVPLISSHAFKEQDLASRQAVRSLPRRKSGVNCLVTMHSRVLLTPVLLMRSGIRLIHFIKWVKSLQRLLCFAPG